MKSAAFMTIAVSLAAAVSANAQDGSLDVRLVCDGAGERTARVSTFGNAFRSDGESVTGSATTYGRERLQERVTIEIKGAAGRIRFPSTLLPAISGRGKEGWFELTDLKVSADQVEARFNLNIFNHPRVRLDRTTGEIDVAGFGNGFRGACTKQDTSERLF